MDEALRFVHVKMRQIGLAALAHANWHAHYHSMENDCWSELSVLQAAHAAELLIKSRIAQENPLLIFDRLPKLRSEAGRRLNFTDLVESGRTIQYNDLPDRLWATTGIEVPDLNRFREFGRLRNCVQHFSPPELDLSQTVLEFIFSVIDPFIFECWGLYAIDFNEDHEPYIYWVPGIIQRGILFNVSRESVDDIEHMDIQWPSMDGYKETMTHRIALVTTNGV